jgi:phosphate starvation-inducible protein PhoH and related proteins
VSAMRTVIPRTMNQEKYAAALHSKKPIVFAIGPAGCGKTLLACQVGLHQLKHQDYDKLVLTRPATSAGEEHGFLPGTLDKKMGPWMQPLMDSFSLRGNDIDRMKKNDQLEIAPFAYMRGRTFNNSWIIADEMQNATTDQIKMLLTRIGNGSKIVVTGDLQQCDIPNSGLEDFIFYAEQKENLDHIDIIHLDSADIVRHDAVIEVLDIYDLKKQDF